MSDTKPMMEMIPTMSKIIEHKLIGITNYHDWRKTIILYLRSIDKNDHMTDDPPEDDSKKTWLWDDAQLILQIRNSIDGEVLGLMNHLSLLKN